MNVIASEEEDFVRWRFVSMEVNNHERPDVFVGAPALKVFRMLVAKAASQKHPTEGYRKAIAILDVAAAFFHASMDETIYVHPPREAEPEFDRDVVRMLRKTHCEAAGLWQEYLRKDEFVQYGWDTIADEPEVYYWPGARRRR